MRTPRSAAWGFFVVGGKEFVLPGGERAKDRALVTLEVADKDEGTAVQTEALVVQAMRVVACRPAVQDDSALDVPGSPASSVTGWTRDVAAGTVLLRNEHNALPITESVSSILVIATAATSQCVVTERGSAFVRSDHVTVPSNAHAAHLDIALPRICRPGGR